jgi:hypothetical protein
VSLDWRRLLTILRSTLAWSIGFKMPATTTISTVSPSLEITSVTVATSSTSANSCIDISKSKQATTSRREDTLGGRTSAYLDVWLFDNHSLLNFYATSATIFGSHEPLLIGICEHVDRKSAFAELVICKFGRPKANSPVDLKVLMHARSKFLYANIRVRISLGTHPQEVPRWTPSLR